MTRRMLPKHVHVIYKPLKSTPIFFDVQNRQTNGGKEFSPSFSLKSQDDYVRTCTNIFRNWCTKTWTTGQMLSRFLLSIYTCSQGYDDAYEGLNMCFPHWRNSMLHQRMVISFMSSTWGIELRDLLHCIPFALNSFCDSYSRSEDDPSALIEIRIVNYKSDLAFCVTLASPSRWSSMMMSYSRPFFPLWK